MRSFNLQTAILVAGLALVAGPAFAQKAGPGGGGNGGNGGGGANAGGGGSSAGSSSVVGSTSSSGSTSTTSTSSSGFSSPSAGGGPSSASYRGSGAIMRTAAPEHRTSLSYSSDQQHATATATAQPRASSSAPAQRAPSSAPAQPRTSTSPRTASPANGAQSRANTTRAVPRGSAATNNPAGNAEVPSWSRNRGGRPSTGTAVPRSPDNPAPGTAAYYQYYLSHYGYYNPYYYDPSGIYGYYGLGGGYYGFYNPYYSPYGFGGYGLDPGFGYPYYGDPNDPYMYGDGYGSYSSRVYSGEGQGALKLKVKPKDAKVYVDGYFAGLADQKLTLNGGNHKVEVKAEGYETAEVDVLITPGKTLTFAGDLKKLQ